LGHRFGTQGQRAATLAVRRLAVSIPAKEALEAPKYPTFTTEYVQLPGYQVPLPTSKAVAGVTASAVSRGGLKGLGIPSQDKEWPSKSEVLAAIPKHCFKRNTAKSLAYAAGSTALTLGLGAAGAAWLPTKGLAAVPLWAMFAAATGTAATGCWVVAHECGKTGGALVS